MTSMYKKLLCMLVISNNQSTTSLETGMCHLHKKWLPTTYIKKQTTTTKKTYVFSYTSKMSCRVKSFFLNDEIFN